MQQVSAGHLKLDIQSASFQILQLFHGRYVKSFLDQRQIFGHELAICINKIDNNKIDKSGK